MTHSIKPDKSAAPITLGYIDNGEMAKFHSTVSYNDVLRFPNEAISKFRFFFLLYFPRMNKIWSVLKEKTKTG